MDQDKMNKKSDKKYSQGIQMSDTFCNSAFLALSGGFQDAYTYNTREEVFSNAQTGNIVLMSQHIMVGAWKEAVRYLFPLLAFVLGVLIAERLKHYFGQTRQLHWKQVILLIEILILFFVGLIPTSYSMLASGMVSLTCAMQVQTFRKMKGYSYASTMCIGNLRSGTAALSVYLREKKWEQLKQVLYYFGIIFIFAVGAGIGGNLSLRFGIRMIWFSCALLQISFMMMFIQRPKRRKGIACLKNICKAALTKKEE